MKDNPTQSVLPTPYAALPGLAATEAGVFFGQHSLPTASHGPISSAQQTNTVSSTQQTNTDHGET
jgi:hypothetical protein